MEGLSLGGNDRGLISKPEHRSSRTKISLKPFKEPRLHREVVTPLGPWPIYWFTTLWEVELCFLRQKISTFLTGKCSPFKTSSHGNKFQRRSPPLKVCVFEMAEWWQKKNYATISHLSFVFVYIGPFEWSRSCYFSVFLFHLPPAQKKTIYIHSKLQPSTCPMQTSWLLHAHQRAVGGNYLIAPFVKTNDLYKNNDWRRPSVKHSAKTTMLIPMLKRI
jgi:hypothetical protein